MEETPSKQTKEVDRWNRDNPVGTKVTARMFGTLKFDGITTSEAYLQNDMPCVDVDGRVILLEDVTA